MNEKALQMVRELLARRLENAGIRAHPPELYFQLEACAPEPYPGGIQIRVKTFRKWSDARVKLDADTGDFLGYAVDRNSDPLTRSEITQEQAITVASQAMNIPQDAELESFRMFEYAPQRRMAELVWRHMFQGLRVDGDRLRIVLHPQTGRIVQVERFWRTVRLA